MRIVVVNNFFPPRPGGSAHLADALARHYAAAGHEVMVLTATYQGAPEFEERDGIVIHRLPAWTLPATRFAANFDIGFTISPRTVRRVNRLLAEFRPDVINQHGQFFDLTWITGWWARRHRVPTLLAIHTRLYSPKWSHNAIYRAGDALLVWPMMRWHRPELVVMDVHMDRYIASRYRGAHSGTVAIPVGVNLDAIRSGDADAARSALQVGDRPLILSVGHVIPQRNRIALIEALPAVLAAVPDAIVVVLGRVYYDEFLRRAAELGVDGSVLAPGAVPQREVADYLAAASVEVHELDGQGFGTASLEALAAGVPVVAAIRPDNFLETVVEDGTHLYLSGFVSETDERADPQDLARVLIDVLTDPEARSRVAENARALVTENFTMTAVGDAYLAAMERLATDGAR